MAISTWLYCHTTWACHNQDTNTDYPYLTLTHNFKKRLFVNPVNYFVINDTIRKTKKRRDTEGNIILSTVTDECKVARGDSQYNGNILSTSL